MCRIDAPFGNLDLDEKKDPQERFLQAIDEHGINGYLRESLIKHISENWKDIFSNLGNLETALANTQKLHSELEKCVAIVFYEGANFRHRLPSFLHDETYQKSLLFKLLVDVADTYSSASPFNFYSSSGIDKYFRSYSSFIHWFYGEEYFFTNEFLKDNSLVATNDAAVRTKILWNCFYKLSPQFDCVKYGGYDDSLHSQLEWLAISDRIAGPYTKDCCAIIRGLEFLKLWVKCDAEIGLISFDPNSTFYRNDYDSPLKKLAISTANTEISTKYCRNWLIELDRVLILNTDLRNATASQIEQWANFVDDLFRYINLHLDYDPSQREKYRIQYKNELNRLCSQLGELQLHSWIKWSIEKDFHSVLGNNQSCSSPSISAEKWVCQEYIEIWEKLFLDMLNSLSPELQLQILSAPPCICDGESNEFGNNFNKWWTEQLSNLVENGDLPNQLLPDWTITVLSRFDDQKILPYIDKSIGILRGRFFELADSKQLDKHNEKLSHLLESLNRISPIKSFHHRWLLIRVSKELLSDDSLSVKYTLNHWYLPISDLINKIAYELYRKNYRNTASTDTPKSIEQITYDTCLTYTHELAEFCLKRLRLRRGEKIVDGKYTSEQVNEISTRWRQGYLKVLSELGCDLNGTVHKAVYFTKQSDPDSAVREIASECYKAVRRNSKVNQSITDLKRAIIGAEWWLLMCQRNELGENVNSEAAIKTRRNLMRHL